MIFSGLNPNRDRWTDLDTEGDALDAIDQDRDQDLALYEDPTEVLDHPAAGYPGRIPPDQRGSSDINDRTKDYAKPGYDW